MSRIKIFIYPCITHQFTSIVSTWIENKLEKEQRNAASNEQKANKIAYYRIFGCHDLPLGFTRFACLLFFPVSAFFSRLFAFAYFVLFPSHNYPYCVVILPLSIRPPLARFNLPVISFVQFRIYRILFTFFSDENNAHRPPFKTYGFGLTLM